MIMKKEEILSERAIKATKKVKAVAGKASEYFSRRAVGGQIHEKNYHLWEKYKQRCIDHKVQMNPNGMEHILKLSNEIDAVFFPIAKASGLDPVLFAEERIDKLLKAVKNNNDWIDETDRLHNNITSRTDKKLVIQIKET